VWIAFPHFKENFGATPNAFHGNYGCGGQKHPLNLEPVERMVLYVMYGHKSRLSLEQKALVCIMN
jgi:hypothetical protein